MDTPIFLSVFQVPEYKNGANNNGLLPRDAVKISSVIFMKHSGTVMKNPLEKLMRKLITLSPKQFFTSL